MKNLLKNWKKFKLTEENDLDIPQNPSVDAPSNESVELIRQYLQEVQNMAIRLVQIEEEIKNSYNSGETEYYPGKEFQIAARHLADAENWGSLSSRLNRWIENEVSLPIKQRQYFDNK